MHNTLEELQAFLLVPPVAKFTNDFRTLAREKADKVGRYILGFVEVYF